MHNIIIIYMARYLSYLLQKLKGFFLTYFHFVMKQNIQSDKYNKKFFFFLNIVKIIIIKMQKGYLNINISLYPIINIKL